MASVLQQTIEQKGCLSMLPITLFRNPSATGHTFMIKNGKRQTLGLGWSGLVGLKTLIALVPTTTQMVNFCMTTQTKDFQLVTVSGDVKLTLDPERSVTAFDFTIDQKTGAYLTAWERMLQAIVCERVLCPLRAQAEHLDLATLLRSQNQLSTAIEESFRADVDLQAKGIAFESCSIASIDPKHPDVAKAIGAAEREELLARADQALHDRRMKAVESERALQLYEAQSKLTLETERSRLIAEQGKNEIVKAGAEATATKTRLEPFTEVEAGKGLVAALMKMAEGGRIGTLVVSPELLAALGEGKRS